MTLTTRQAPMIMSGAAALRGRKVPYAHVYNTLIMPYWLGSGSGVESTAQWGKGDVKVRYRRDRGDAMGAFNAASKYTTAPSASPVTMTVKEHVGEAIYNLGDTPLDIDIRAQSCGRVDDPVNWDMIKRLRGCLLTDLSTSGETSSEPRDEGETNIKIQFTSEDAPYVIYPVEPQVVNFYDETRFAEYNFFPVVAACRELGYALPAVASGAIYDMFTVAVGDDVKHLVSGSPLLPYNPVSIACHENIVIVADSNGLVYWSGDGGKTFALATGVHDIRVVKVWSYSNILAGGVAGIYKSTDGGRTFESVDPYGAIGGDTVVDIAYHNGLVAYAVTDTALVSMSEDGGETFVRTGEVPLSLITSMIILDGVLMVGGFGDSGTPAIVGSEDGGYTWFLLMQIVGSMSLEGISKVRLAVEGCGVVIASLCYASLDANMVYSDVYRNVNWGAAGAWERIWQDVHAVGDMGSWIMLFDIASAHLNDALAIGVLPGASYLMVGVKFNSVG